MQPTIPASISTTPNSASPETSRPATATTYPSTRKASFKPDPVDREASSDAVAAPVAVGGAAILAQLKARKAAASSPLGEKKEEPSSAPSPPPPSASSKKIVVAFASQTGTGTEIARNIQAEAVQRGLKAEVSSLNALGFANLTPKDVSLLIIVASSTGDGDPPDNSANFWVQMKKKQTEEKSLSGIRFSVLGLGDSNYTRFMHVPRTFKNKLLELGADLFYPYAEADDVDGIESVVDPWVDGLWDAINKALVDGTLVDKALALTSSGEVESVKVETVQAPNVNLDHHLSASSPQVSTPPLLDEAADVVQAQPSDLKAEAEAALQALVLAASALTTSPSPALVNASSRDNRRSLDSPRGVSSRPSSPRPGSPSEASRGRRGSIDKSVAVVDINSSARPSSRMSSRSNMAKPSSVHFPKREEATVPRKDERAYGLICGLAPIGVDIKGAPAPLPCRIKVSWEKDSSIIAKVKSGESPKPSPEELRYRDPDGLYSKEQPFWAAVSDARYETAHWSDRKVLHLELGLDDSGMVYEAGDSIGILPCNPPELVANTLKRLGLKAEDVFVVKGIEEGGPSSLLPHLPSPCTVGYAFSRCLDLTGAPKKSLLRLLADHCSEPSEKRTLTYFSSRGGKEAYQHEVLEHQPSLYDLLSRFSSCSPPLDALLDALPPLMPRLYSITTSFVDSPDKVQVALSVVRFRTRYGSRAGVASTWLDRMTRHLTRGEEERSSMGEIPRVEIFLKKSVDFKPPRDLSKPLIMVGPGTGIAPFRGFLQHRRAMRAAAGQEGEVEGVGPSWLFFGCRREDEDYLYKSDIEGFTKDKTLTHLEVAFSRAQADKVYVQDLIKKKGAELASLIVDKGAYVFVCGDGAGMAKDVHAALLLAIKENGMEVEKAAQVLATMVQEKRYIRDVWS